MVDFEPIALRLKTPFRIAHGESLVRQNVIVRLGDGIGEAALPPYYEHTVESVSAYLNTIDPDELIGEEPFALEPALDRIPQGPAPARAALDVALHDHWAKGLGLPLYRLWGLDPSRAPVSTFTLSIPDTLDAFERQLDEVRDFPFLKLKLGAGDPDRDLEIVRFAQRHTRADLCVDANGAWTVETAARLIPALTELNVRFVEQPIPAGDAASWRRLRDHLPEGVAPLIADESVRTVSDLFSLAGAADGINVKLAKSGGLREARRMITLARTLGMQVMIGCMIESAVGLTAAAHLAPLADYADLDAGLLVADDPFTGMTLENGRIVLPERPGLGVRQRS